MKIYKGQPAYWAVRGNAELWIIPIWAELPGGYNVLIHDVDMNVIASFFWKTNGWIVGDNSALHHAVAAHLDTLISN